MGVCAGMILMAESVDDERVTPLKILPFRALRNHYGRQVHSFTANIQLGFDTDGDPLKAHFIRAPGVADLGEGMEVLARYNDEIIMIGKDRHLALSFHPELTGDIRDRGTADGNDHVARLNPGASGHAARLEPEQGISGIILILAVFSLPQIKPVIRLRSCRYVKVRSPVMYSAPEKTNRRPRSHPPRPAYLAKDTCSRYCFLW